DVEFLVVVVRVGREQDAEAVADGDAGRDDEEGVGEPLVVRVAALVEHLPGDEHGHHDRLAAAGRHLARDAEQVGPRLLRLLPEILSPGPWRGPGGRSRGPGASRTVFSR